MWPGPTTPGWPKPSWFGLFRVRSPLLTESLICFLFLEVLRWFTSLGLPLPAYEFGWRSLDMTPVGLPHSEISGSKRACRSPKHIAACHVLHRLSVPRHPPSTLSNLTIKCLDLMRSAVLNLTDSSCISFLQPIFNCQRTLRSRRPTLSSIDVIALTARLAAAFRDFVLLRELVELIGIEPTTPCLQSRCSPS
jgi:hypothetical protein